VFYIPLFTTAYACIFHISQLNKLVGDHTIEHSSQQCRINH